MELRKSASKAFLVSASILVASMLIVTVGTLLTGGLEGKDIFAAPLIGFYVAIVGFVLAFPVALVFFLYRSRQNGRVENES